MTKSEHEPRLQKLADGSRWGGNVVIDELGYEISESLGVLCVDGPNAHSECFATDALAVIRRANLDPLAIAAKELAKACRSGSVAIHGGQRDAGSFFAALEKLEALL